VSILINVRYEFQHVHSQHYTLPLVSPTNKSIDVDMTESGSYRIVDSRNGRQNIIQGTYQDIN
jgi:hypothetical protein